MDLTPLLYWLILWTRIDTNRRAFDNRPVTPPACHFSMPMAPTEALCLVSVLQAEPIRVLVTGAAGQIAYSLLFGIAKGDVFGKDQVKKGSLLLL